MNGPARLLMCCVIAISAANTAHAQPTIQPTPPPIVTADNEPWYRSGDPLVFAGNIYYPAGPQIHFNGNEMVRSGFYQGVPLYSRTTVEPYSVVYVPVAGGTMQPYERRRTGELAGTVGSFAPSFPVAPATEVTAPAIPQAPAPPALASPTVIGATSPAPAELPVGVLPALGTAAVAPQPVGTSGRAAAVAARRTVPVRRRTDAANGIFIEFNDARWFASGSPTLLDNNRFTRIGELRGFPVYAERGGGSSTIYVPVAEGLELLAPYSKRSRN